MGLFTPEMMTDAKRAHSAQTANFTSVHTPSSSGVTFIVYAGS